MCVEHVVHCPLSALPLQPAVDDATYQGKSESPTKSITPKKKGSGKVKSKDKDKEEDVRNFNSGISSLKTNKLYRHIKSAKFKILSWI